MIWNNQTQQFENDDGEPIADATVRSWVDDWALALILLFTSRSNDVLKIAAADDFNAAALTESLRTWEFETRKDLKAAHYASSSLAFGGIYNTDPADWEIAESFNAEQLTYFDQFTAGVLFGTIALDGYFSSRTGMYASSIYAGYENTVRFREIRNGKSEERRRLGAVDHCVDCLEQAALGWSPVGTLRRIGDSVCKTRCRCWFQYR